MKINTETKMEITKEIKQEAADIKADVESQFEQTREQLEQAAEQADTRLKQEAYSAESTASEVVAEAKAGLKSAVTVASAQVSETLEQTRNAPRETIKGVTRQMAEAEQNWVEASALKRRLDWGEPALTIIDVRHNEEFQQERIQGAVSAPEADLVEKVSAMLEPARDIFIYGATETQVVQCAKSLVDAGYKNVAAIEGGLAGWKTVAGATEGIVA